MLITLIIGWLITTWFQAPMQNKPDELSLMTTPVLLFNDRQQVSLGTGFFFSSTTNDGKPGIPFLVTNYHVLTGYAPGEKGPRKGDRIRFFLHRDPAKPQDVKQVEYPLFTKGGDPVWIADATEPLADVALIPLPGAVFDSANVVVFSDKDITSPMRIGPMSTVTLIGYPHGYFDTTNFLPIWKTGSIASEPLFNFNGKPLFVVDVSAFPGMSGSPVMAIARGTYSGKDGSTVVGTASELLGIFASIQVLNEKKFVEEIAIEQGKKAGIVVSTSLDLGHVWKAAIIARIVKSFDADLYQKKILNNLR